MSKSITFKVLSGEGLGAAAKWLNDNCCKALTAGPVIITLGRESKSRAQEAKYHVLIKDIAKLLPNRSPKAWKCLLVKWYDIELIEAGTPLHKPGERIWDSKYMEWTYIRPSTKDFWVAEAGEFIEYLYAFGSNENVKWSAQSTDIYNEYKEAQR